MNGNPRAASQKKQTLLSVEYTVVLKPERANSPDRRDSVCQDAGEQASEINYRKV